MGIKIVTDSTSDFPKALAAELGVTIVPLNVHFGDEVYVDGVTISQEEFLDKLTKSAVMPRSSQPSPGAFKEVYEQLAADGSEIISIHIGEKLSGTIQSARLAAEMLPEAKITIVDTRSATMAEGGLVCFAAEAAKAGKSKEEILDLLNRLIPAAADGNILLVDTLEYLEKNGRIGKAASLLGSILSMKVLIRIDDIIHPVGKERGRAKAVKSLVNYAVSKAGKRPMRLFVAHVDAREEAEQIVDQLKQELNLVGDVIFMEMGPVISTHTGPKTVGVCWLPVE